MTLRQYLTLMSIGTLLCWVAFVVVLSGVDPTGASMLEFLFFYASLFLGLLGTFSVFGFLLRRLFLKDDDVLFRHVRHTFRQSLIISLVIIFLLILTAQNLLTWWNFPLPIILGIFLEAIIFTNRKFRNVM